MVVYFTYRYELYTWRLQENNWILLALQSEHKSDKP